MRVYTDYDFIMFIINANKGVSEQNPKKNLWLILLTIYQANLKL